MSKPLGRIGAVLVAGAMMGLIGVNRGGQAQQAPQPKLADHFVTVGEYHINIGDIIYVKEYHQKSTFRVSVHLRGATTRSC